MNFAWTMWWLSVWYDGGVAINLAFHYSHPVCDCELDAFMPIHFTVSINWTKSGINHLQHYWDDCIDQKLKKQTQIHPSISYTHSSFRSEWSSCSFFPATVRLMALPSCVLIALDESCTPHHGQVASQSQAWHTVEQSRVASYPNLLVSGLPMSYLHSSYFKS